jgi:cysteinyl-tRNA synthetase
MVLRVHNTMSREKETFVPISGNRVCMFVCGPTTYDLSHIGHARTYVAYDIIASYLRYKGYTLFYVMNITDVDDKIIAKAKEVGEEPLKLAWQYEKCFYEDMTSLRIRSINLFARASEHITEIIDQIKTLIEKGYAYETETGVYYDISKFEDFGALSHQDPSELKEHRIEPDPTKKNEQDFALWKKRETNELGWESPWKWGRPGWHIEDTAITTRYLGSQYDIHGGAVELVFPHHEAEIAQAEAATGKRPLVKYWVHTGILMVNGKKMSKSLGNFITIRNILERYDSEVLRLFFASAHYRSVIDFNERSFEQAKTNLKTLYDALDSIQKAERSDEISDHEREFQRGLLQYKSRFIEAMDDDFNTPVALAVVFEMANEIEKFAETQKKINKEVLKEVVGTFKELGGILGIFQKEATSTSTEVVTNLVGLVIELRQKFRENKDYEMSDLIRSKLGTLGFSLQDTPDGAIWKTR